MATLLLVAAAAVFASSPPPPCAAGLARDEAGRCVGWSPVVIGQPATQGAASAVLSDGRLALLGGAYRGEDPTAGAASPALAFHPGDGTWTPLASLPQRRWDAAALLLDDGRVLVAGGSDGESPLSSAVVLSPGDGGAWAAAGQLHRGRRQPGAVRLSGGRALVYGGVGNDGAVAHGGDLFAPSGEGEDVEGVWSALGEPWNTWQVTAALTLGADGLLLFGLSSEDDSGAAVARVDATFAVAQRLPAPPGLGHVVGATRLTDGRALVLGRDAEHNAGVALLNLESGEWQAAPPLPQSLVASRLVALRDDRVGVLGAAADAPTRPLLWVLNGAADAWQVAPTPPEALTLPLQWQHLPDGRHLATDGQTAALLVY